MIDNRVLADASLVLDPVHDGRHLLRQEAKARESVPYLLNLPEQGIALFTYTWVNAASEAGAVMAIFGPGVGDKPIVDALPDRPVPADMGFDNWRIGGFTMQQDGRFDHASLNWQTEQVKLDLQFEAFHPPYAYGSDARGCMPYVADDRIEQSGRSRGTLQLGDRVITFDTTGHRDHSWGTRDWAVFQHYRWVHAQAGKDVSVHFWQVEALGRTELRGYVYKAGRMALVTAVDFRCDYEGALNPTRFDATITDADGRTTTLNARIVSRFQMHPDPAYCLNENAGFGEIDGQPGVAWVEIFFPEAYRQHIADVGPAVTGPLLAR
jgi:hypothetical protein